MCLTVVIFLKSKYFLLSFFWGVGYFIFFDAIDDKMFIYLFLKNLLHKEEVKTISVNDDHVILCEIPFSCCSLMRPSSLTMALKNGLFLGS